MRETEEATTRGRRLRGGVNKSKIRSMSGKGRNK